MDIQNCLDEWSIKYKLKPKEIILVTLVVKGLNNSEISKAVGILEKTVRSRLHVIFRILNVKSRTELVVKFYRETHIPKQS